MKFTIHKAIIVIIFFSLSAVNAFAQTSTTKPTRQSSLEAFSKGNYEKAYQEFSELLLTYSKDPLYKYYAGVCLVKLEKDPLKAELLLQQALEINAAARPLPEDALFYLARAQQLSGNFSVATASYNRFADQAGRKASREFGVPDFIQQCAQEKGALKVENAVVPVKTEATVSKLPEKKQPEKQKAAEPTPETVVKAQEIKLQSTTEPLAESYSVLLDEALAYQYLADSLSDLAQNRKQSLDRLPDDKRGSAKAQIAEYERAAGNYQKSADRKYAEAHFLMNPGEPDRDTILLVAEQDAEIDSAGTAPEEVVQSAQIADTLEIYSYFSISDSSSVEQKSSIAIDPEVPEGLIYRVQIAVFRNPVSPVFFKRISPVYGFRNEGSELKTYYAGMFRRLEDARKALAEVKGKGFKDSFISSFNGNKQVSPDRAAVLEKEWGLKPFERLVSNKPVVISADTLPPTLIFRVEVMRVTKAPKPNVIESIKTLAGSRGLDILTLEDKKIAYLIGNFITFESAAEYADLIVRNGFRDARVVAWLGKREIPLDTAKQLFDNLK